MRSSWGEAKSWGRPQLHPMPEHALPAMHFQTSQHAQHGHSIKSSTPVRSQDVTAGQQKLHGADRDSMDRLSGALGQPQQAVWSTQASSPGVSGEVQPPLSNNSLQAGAIDNEVQELKLQSQQNEPEQATINRVSAETVSSSEQSSPAKTALQSLSTSRRQLQQLVSLQNSMASLPKQAPGSGEAVDGRSQVQQLPAVQQQKAQPAYSDSATESESELESGSETESDSEAEQQRVQQKAKTKQPTAITVRSTRNSQSLDRQSVRSTRSSEDDQHQSAALQQQMKQQPLSNASPDMVPKNSAQKPAGDKQPAQKTRWNVFAKPAR